jgi:hypothetical protein
VRYHEGCTYPIVVRNGGSSYSVETDLGEEPRGGDGALAGAGTPAPVAGGTAGENGRNWVGVAGVTQGGGAVFEKGRECEWPPCAVPSRVVVDGAGGAQGPPAIRGLRWPQTK